MNLLSPTVDFIFKKIFGNEKNPDILISFLNSVLKPKHLITCVEIKNTEITQDYLRDKFSRLDVKAITSNNEVVNIEIQRADQKNMLERTLYYWSKMYAENIIEGENYSILPKTICINILDYEINELKKETNYHNVYRLSNVSSNNFVTDKIEIHFIELKKFQQCNANNSLDLWIEFMKNPTGSVIADVENVNSEIKKAKTELTVISADKETREKYQIRQDTIREETFALNGARLEGIEIGREEGHKEGHKEGIEEGIGIGREEGIEEGIGIGHEKGSYDKSIETAKKMLRYNEPIEKIADYTDLSKEDILRIKEDI